MSAMNPDCPLEVRVRQTLAADGTISTYSSVYCPRQECSVRANECIDCDEYVGLSFDRQEQTELLRCRASRTPTPRQALRTLLSKGPQEALQRRFRLRADRTPVSNVMSINVYCVRDNVGLRSLANVLLDSGFSGAPVVDKGGKPIGVVSKTDLLRYQYEPNGNERGRETPKTVRDIMTHVSFTLKEGASVSRGAALMAFEGIHRVPVVDEGGRAVGLLSSLDILHWLAGESGYVVPPPRSWRGRRLKRR